MNTYISMGIITEALLFLETAKRLNCFNLFEISKIRNKYVDPSIVVEFITRCRWITLQNDEFELTECSKNILQCFDGYNIPPFLLRKILMEYILAFQPIWSKRIPNGRKEAFLFMSDEEKRCFIIAELMSTPPSREIIDWWDLVAEEERESNKTNLLVIGRDGEEKTIKYETDRTGSVPIWQSIETNLAGYDIISKESNCFDSKEILIEVKSSNYDVHNAYLIISKHEWEVANYKNNYYRYYFYLWLLGKTNKMAKVTVEEMSKHIPIEMGEGSWENVRIPFYVFTSRFEIVSN